jgi:general stress protein 26
MEEIYGMLEAFRGAKLVYLTTTGKTGGKHTRPMTNFNTSPYESMWFPSFKNTRKIEDIKHNSNVTISFPTKEVNTWFKINGEASEASREEVLQKWRWWFLEWIPESDKKPLHYDDPFLDRSVIWVKPVKAWISNMFAQDTLY